MFKLKVSNKFIYIWFAELISILGTGLTEFGLSVWIFQKTGRATPLALSILCAILPVILLSPAAGFIADKYNTKWIIILSDIGAALTSAAFIFFLWKGFFSLPLTCGVILLNSVFNLFDSAAAQSSIVLLVDKEDLKSANGLNQISDSLNNLMTPVIAGILYAFIGLSGIITIDMATYILSMVMWLFFPTNVFDKHLSDCKGESQKWDGRQFLHDLNDGFKFIFGIRGFTILVVLFAIVNFLNNLAVVLITPLVISIGNSTQLGIVQAFGGIGMLAGSLIATFRKSDKPRIMAVKWYILAASVFLIVMGLRASFMVISLSRMLFLLFIPLANVAAGTVWQLKTPKELQGRVYTARSMIIRSIMPIAYLIVGPITDTGFKNLFAMHSGIIAGIRNVLGANALNYRVVFILCGLTLLIVTYTVFRGKALSDIDKLTDYS